MRNISDYAMVSTMKRVGAVGTSANRITLLRDADGGGVAEMVLSRLAPFATHRAA
jgi:hypothetical protein